MGSAGRKNATSLIIGLIQSANMIWTKRSRLLKSNSQQPHAIPPQLAIPTEVVSGANPPLYPGDLARDAARAQPSMPSEAAADVYGGPIPPTGFPQPNPPDGRIHHPGRDPTSTNPSGCFDLPGP
jgi:hypothetical protein